MNILYVDHARIPYGRMLINHLPADTPRGAPGAAERLGLPAHIQHPGTPKECLDVSESKRQEAIRMGAVEITGRRMVEIVRAERGTGANSPRQG